MHYDKTDVSARENERFRVRNFAHALRSLPLRDNGAIRRVEGAAPPEGRRLVRDWLASDECDLEWST